MSIFARTTSGLKNYHLFYNKDFVAYIEGKVTDEEIREDVLYYEILFGEIFKKNIKIKCVGNKDYALLYASFIREADIKNSFVVVDKDFEGLTSSTIPRFPIVRTYGYSWENELWQYSTIESLIKSLTGSNSKASQIINDNLSRLFSRAKLLSCLDVAAQVNGSSLLRKNTSLCGIRFSDFGIEKTEVVRIIGKFKATNAHTCPTSRAFLSMSTKSDSIKVIQGHFWSNLAYQFVATVYKKVCLDNMPTKKLLTNLAFNNLRSNPKNLIGDTVLSHYERELSAIGK